MSKQMRWIAMIVLLLSLATLACGALGGGNEPTAEPADTAVDASAETEETTTETEAGSEGDEPAAEETETEVEAEEPTAVPTEIPPTEEPETDAESDTDTSTDDAPETLDLAAAFNPNEEFQSYRFLMALEFMGTRIDGEEVSQTMLANIAYSLDPKAMEMAINMEGIEGAEEFGELTMAQILDTTYMVVPGMGCITTSADETNLFDDNPFGEMLAPDAFLDELENPELVGEEEINGIQTFHYTFDENAFSPEDDEITDADGHLYIAKDGRYLVRMVMDAEGNIDFFDEGVDQEGSLHLEFDLTDINEPVEIAMPEECSGENAANTEFPLMEDAYEVSSFAGFVTYSTDATVADTVAFYEEALAAEDWVPEEGGSFITDTSAILTYNRGEETLNLTISLDEESGATMVVLISDPGEGE